MLSVGMSNDKDKDRASGRVNKNQLRLARALFYSRHHVDNDNQKDIILETFQFLQRSSGDPAFAKRAAKLQQQISEHWKRRNKQKQHNNDTPFPTLPSIHWVSLLDGCGIHEYYAYGHDSVTSALGPGQPVTHRDNERPEPCSPSIRLENVLKEKEERQEAATISISSF